MRLFRQEHRRVLDAFYGSESEAHAHALEGLSAFLEKEVLPVSRDLDLKTRQIGELRRKVFDYGLTQMAFRLGDVSVPFGVYVLAMELMGAADAPTAMSVGIHNTAVDVIQRYGSEHQKERFLADLMSGHKLASFALTEPSSGSDARTMATRATREDDHYRLTGSKMFITNAGEADIYVVFAAAPGGHSAFIVERSTPGLFVGGDIQKLGMRGSRTAELRFDDCEVPAENLVGEDGAAFSYAKAVLDGSRIVMGSVCVGIASIAYRRALEYSSQRRLFGGRLSDLQLTREKIANMRTDIAASRLMCAYASILKESGSEYSSEAAQAKVTATESAIRVCDDAIQLFGGYGYTDDDIHRHWRDARLLTIGEGASEVLRMLIAAKELAGVGERA